MPKFLPFRLSSLHTLSDEQAMQRVQAQGDEAAFAGLVQRWELPLQRLCTRMTGDEHLGQDLAQETFTRVYVRREAYNGRSKFSTWLWRIALNLCHDELRRRKRRGNVSEIDSGGVDAVLAEAADETLPAPDVATQQLEVALLVQHALQRLPEAYRAVLVLRHYEGLKFREIAEVLDIPEGTVKSRMTEALDQLHRLLRRSCHSRPSAPSSTHFQQLVVL
jgi:RNA polymerase sigma-70 factor (ECF subfamily)